jgi:hypothetical protein
MISRTTRTLMAIVFAAFIAISASAAPEDRSESRDWLARQVDRVVQQLKKIFAPSPYEDPLLNPPKP